MANPINRLTIALLCGALAACTSADPVQYSGLDSSAQLTRNQQDDADHVPYRYTTDVNWRNYSNIIIDPVVIYQGPDSQFGTMSGEDKAELAHYMQATFAEKLKRRFRQVQAPAPDTLRLRLTLTGAATNRMLLSTLSRLDLAGGLYNGVQAVRGGEGTFTGSVIYAVELHDAATNRLLGAYVAKQYPGSFNIAATMGSLAAAKTGIEKGANDLAARLR